ncbi:hypothetical protein J132_08346 [Termitomyces sp. J132]|nr:hypothetical protein J132_08346 [Termitomyces sp. J132]
MPIPTTPVRDSDTVRQVPPPTSADVKVMSREFLQITQNQALHIHPRYEIAIKGCCSRVYNIRLAEHPRPKDRVKVVRWMKPYWVAPSYRRPKMNKESRLGAEVVIANNNNNNDDNDDEYYESTNEEAEEDMVAVNQYSDTEDAGAEDVS